MSSVALLPLREERVPERDPYLKDDDWLITIFAEDKELVGLVRYLHRVHRIITVGEFDAAGHEIANGYSGLLQPSKRKAFFDRVGRKRPNVSRFVPLQGAAVLKFERA